MLPPCHTGPSHTGQDCHQWTDENLDAAKHSSVQCISPPNSDARACTPEVMFRRKQRLAFDQVSEFNRGRIVAYRDRGLTFREIGSRVG
ncbi:hypothetical protein TNCV_3110891 [Trichonephila clavipes]|nr:hypothetical protein TNCV_3110891 [Trichonephila clavipes]